MTRSNQLRLVTEPAPAHDAHTHTPTADPVRRVFEHWVFMFGRCPRRTKLDTVRRQAIGGALALYDGDVELIMQAVEGMAAVPLGDKPASMREAMVEPQWFLATAARIERALRYADDLRAMAQDRAARAAVPVVSEAPADPAAVAAARERLRQLAAECRGMNG